MQIEPESVFLLSMSDFESKFHPVVQGFKEYFRVGNDTGHGSVVLPDCSPEKQNKYGWECLFVGERRLELLANRVLHQ